MSASTRSSPPSPSFQPLTGNNNNPPKKNNTMKHEYTKLQAAIAEHKALTADYWAARWHDEVDARNRQYNELECTRAIAEKALTELAKTKENGLSQLRPLAEADDVPEGCVRVRAWEDINRWIYGWNEWDGDTHFADIRLPESAEKPKPETFEAHGKTWTKHKPGDAMPCDGSSAVMALLGDGTFCTQQAEDWNWNNRDSTFDIVGWCYADEPTPEPLVTKPISPPTWTPEIGDVVTLKSGGAKMTVVKLADTESDLSAFLCEWFSDSGEYDSGVIYLTSLQSA